MPIYMDRHDMQGGTAEDAADAHRKDLALQDRYGVRFLTYWFDDQRGTTFCLVDAPNKDAVQCVHRDAHGHIPGEIVEVSLSPLKHFLAEFTIPRKQVIRELFRSLLIELLCSPTSLARPK